MAVRGFTMGKCGLLPQHFHHGVNVAEVMLDLSLFQYLLPEGFVLAGKKLITVTVILFIVLFCEEINCSNVTWHAVAVHDDCETPWP